MPLFMTISRGPSADVATPILAISDPRVIAAALDEISRLDDLEDDDDREGLRIVSIEKSEDA